MIGLDHSLVRCPGVFAQEHRLKSVPRASELTSFIEQLV